MREDVIAQDVALAVLALCFAASVYMSILNPDIWFLTAIIFVIVLRQTIKCAILSSRMDSPK